MKKVIFVLSALFFLALTADLYAISSQPLLRVITKLALMPLLLLLYLYETRKQNTKKTLIIAALSFSFLGDTFLLSDSELYFILGIASFLVAQIAYIAYFLKESGGFKIRPASIPLLFFLFIFLGLIYSHIFGTGNNKIFLIPISIYAAIITTMTYCATLRPKKNRKSYWLVLTGAILFLISDSCIAINSFLLSEENLSVARLIMLSYGIAQYFIIRGVAEETTESPKKPTQALRTD